jgi:putative ABC transport system permease protein
VTSASETAAPIASGPRACSFAPVLNPEVRFTVRIPITYNIRSLALRRTTTAMAVFSIGLAVGTFVVLMALAEGLEAILSGTGQEFNVMVVRKGSESETSSSVNRDAVQVIKYLNGVARDGQGQPRLSPEVVIPIVRARRGETAGSNLIVRGLGPYGPSLRPEFRLVEGRLFRPGLKEVIVSKPIAERFADCGLGDRVELGRSYWTVVGIFDAGKSAYSSEVWTDADELREDFARPAYSDVLLRATDAAAVARIEDRVDGDRRLRLEALSEQEYFRAQTKAAGPIRALGALIAILMAVGSSFAAMNTMYATVARRAGEIGTLRAIGFSRRSILLSFALESLFVAGIGGVVGCLLALPINGISTGTTNFVTFSELAFRIEVTPVLLAHGMLFALVMGRLSGLFPARSAAKMDVLAALRRI